MLIPTHRVRALPYQNDFKSADNLDHSIDIDRHAEDSDEEEKPEHNPDNWIGPRSSRVWEGDIRAGAGGTPKKMHHTVPIVPHPSFFIFSPTNP